MKGSDKVLAVLNALLADELTAINQYVVHAEMAENWGYGKLKKLLGSRAMTEMKHAEKLIERILFLEGIPIVSKLNMIRIGADIPKQFTHDLAAEMMAVKNYNTAINVATAADDNATKELLESILKDEDGHVNQIEEKLDQVKQMGIQNFLALQAGE
ncbi:MAG: bacterioferritin [bacterium]